MEAFLHRLAFLAANGTISIDARIRACREVRAVLTRSRAAGLTRPGAVAAGLGEDFTLTTADVPDKPEPADTGRGLPPEIMRELCSHLDALTSPVMRAAVSLAIDTGRRPEEICNLAFDCLARDDDGLPVLVYDNYKANRAARRLPTRRPRRARPACCDAWSRTSPQTPWARRSRPRRSSSRWRPTPASR
jgi:integrase